MKTFLFVKKAIIFVVAPLWLVMFYEKKLKMAIKKEKGTPTISQVVGVRFLKERKEREKRVCKFGQK